MEPSIQYAKNKDGVSIGPLDGGKMCAPIPYDHEQADSGDGNGQRLGEPAPQPLLAG